MEILTTLQKIQENQKKISDSFTGQKTNKIPIKVEDVDQLLQINRTLQYILDKLHSMDQLLRSNHIKGRNGNLYESNAVKERSEKSIEERLKAIDSNLPFL
jgi:hypothetical protein